MSGSTPQAPPPKKHQAKHEAKPKKAPAKPSQPRIATVRVIGGAPPASGPAHLDYPAGEAVRLRVVSDQTVDVELVGLGLSGTVQAGRPTLLAFSGEEAGELPAHRHRLAHRGRADPRRPARRSLESGPP